MTTEFSRPQRLDTLGAGDTHVTIAADADERLALARRFGWKALDRLEANATLRRDAAGIVAEGRLQAEVVQACVVTEQPLPVRVDEPFAIRFVPEPSEDEIADEVELDSGDLDTVFYNGAAVDLGEAAAETLALALDPFPRSPDAEAVLKEAGVLSEGEAGPFGGLAALKDVLGKQ